MHDSPPNVRYALLVEGLTRGEAEEQALVLASAGIAMRVGQDVPLAGQASRRRAKRWLIEVDATRAQDARRLVEEHEDRQSPSWEPEPVMLGAHAGRYWIIGLALLNALVWYAMEARGGAEAHATLIRFGAITTELISSGQWWRTITAVFLHIGARHLLGNSVLLLVLGLLCLRAWGPGRTLFIYLVSGVLGNWAGFAFGSAVALKAGASGAILGLLGGLAGARFRELRRHRGSSGSRFKSWHILAMLVAFYGFVVGVRPSSDHVAHIGGIVAGVSIALLWPYPGKLPPRRERNLQVALGGVATLLAAMGGLLAWITPI